jgi:hypothetical protein
LAATLLLSGVTLAQVSWAGADESTTASFTSDQVGTSGTTPAFSMSAPWTVDWSYSCADYAQGNSFSLTVNQPAGDRSVDAGVSTAGVRGSGSSNYVDTGTFTLGISSACYWSLDIFPTSTPPGPSTGIPEVVTDAATPNPTYVGIAADPGGQGIWTTRADGDVFGLLGGAALGGPALLPLNSPIVSITAARDGYGYYVLGGDGGVFNYGPNFYGSTGGMRLNQPVDGLAVTPDGNGYWLVASDGGVFSYGDASFLGSMGSVRLNQPVVGMVASGGGYTLVAADGGVFNFGTPFLGSLGSMHLDAPTVGMAPTPDGGGYWLVARDGGVFSFGDAAFYGSGAGSGKTFAGIAATPDGNGYWLVASDGTILNFGGAAPA